MNREKMMADITNKVMELNQQLALAGSSMLNVRGINLRKSNDIDFAAPHGVPIVIPNGATSVTCRGGYSRLIVAFNLEGIKVDILSADPRFKFEEIDGIKVTSLSELVSAKLTYIKDFSTAKDQREKHQMDVNRILEIEIGKGKMLK